MGEVMKKFNLLFLFLIFTTLFFTGCSNHTNYFSTPQMEFNTLLRTVGVGESAIPIEKGSFAIEPYIGNATLVDVVSSIDSRAWADFEREEITLSPDIKESSEVLGFNVKYGFNNSTEVKIGFLSGRITHNYDVHLNVDGSETVHHHKSKWRTDFSGVQLGVKHLLTDYNNPFRLSLYLEAKQISFSNDSLLMAKYDAKSNEFKSAIICGYLNDLEQHNIVSLALYHSLANTSRKEATPDVPLKKHPQAIGLEANLNLALGSFYTNLATGLEKEIADKAKSGLVPYFELKVGVHLLRNR